MQSFSPWALAALCTTVSICSAATTSTDVDARFQAIVLELGSVPIPVLAARIDRFIADGGQGPYPDLE